MEALLIGTALLVGIAALAWFYYLQPMVHTQKEEASKFNAILSSIADGVIVQNLAGDIDTMNPSARKILDTVTNHFPSEPVDGDMRLAQTEARLSSLLNFLTGLQNYETETVEIGGRTLSARAAPVITPDQERVGTVIVLRDVTPEVEATMLKDDFITTISHELITPIAVIKGYNDLLRLNAANIVSEYRASFIENVEDVDRTIVELLNLIEQMLDLTQISAGVLGINRARVDLVELIKAEFDRWQQKMNMKTLSGRLLIPDEPIWVEGDEDRLTRVLHNLFKNAYGYTLPGGTIEISVEHGPAQVQVSVRDTGVGISKKDQPFIFSRFFRAIHQDRTYDVGGAGLGLFLSKAIIEAHGGQIWFESEVNRGSTFSFSLPTI